MTGFVVIGAIFIALFILARCGGEVHEDLDEMGM